MRNRRASARAPILRLVYSRNSAFELKYSPNSIMADDDPLALAQRRVWDAQKVVAEQKRRIDGLRAAGASTFDAVQVLSASESNLRLFTEHRDALLSVKRRRQ
jgi:hypothetical protein